MTGMMRLLAGGILVMFAASVLNSSPITGCDPAQEYCPSPLQQRVDKSFSTIAIRTPFEIVRHTLTEDRSNGCEHWGECEWLDANKVRHYLWGNGPDELFIVLKSVKAADFHDRAISALGIGVARQRRAVLANIKRAFPDLRIKCRSTSGSTSVGLVECATTIDPGWIRIGFDKKGQLSEVRFDGYHFT